MSVTDGSNDDPIESSIYSPEMNEADPRDACERSGHVAVGFENELLIWGGSRCALPTFSYNDFCDPNILWVYNTLNDVYTRREILGVPPRGTSGSAAVIHDGSLYIFGGFISSIFSGNMGYSNLLHRVDLTTNKLTWKEIQPKGERPLPCDKLASWVYGDKLYFFGGFGHWVPGSDSSWVRDESERGWNNQLVCYNTKTNEWEWPRTYGPKPRPRAAHSAALSGHTVYIFGGRLESVRNDELHSINMNTMTWSGDLKSTMKGAHWPCGRSWHTFTFVSPTVAFIQGGMSTTDQTLDDIWKLTFQDDAIECEMQPTHIIEGGAACPILWHQSAYFPKGNEIITVGGMKELHGTDSTNHYNKLCTLRLSPKSLFRLSLDALEKIDNVPESEFKTLPAQLKATIRRRLLSTLVYDIEDSDAFYDMDDLHGFGLPYDDIEDFYHEGDDDDDDYDDYDDMYGVFDDDYDDDGAND